MIYMVGDDKISLLDLCLWDEMLCCLANRYCCLKQQVPPKCWWLVN